jgi:hypothetical protein
MEYKKNLSKPLWLTFFSRVNILQVRGLLIIHQNLHL